MSALGGLGGAVLSVKSLGDIRTSPSFAITYFTVQDHPGLFFIHRALDTISHCSMCLPYMIFIGWMWFNHFWKNCISTSWYSSPRQSYFAQPVLYHQLDIINVPYNSIHVLHICMYDSVLPSQQNICSVIYWSFMVKLISVLVFIHALMDSSVQRQFLARIQQLKVSEAKKVSSTKERTYDSLKTREYISSQEKEVIPKSQSKWWYLSAGREDLSHPLRQIWYLLAKHEHFPQTGKQRGYLLASRENLLHSHSQRQGDFITLWGKRASIDK